MQSHASSSADRSMGCIKQHLPNTLHLFSVCVGVCLCVCVCVCVLNQLGLDLAVVCKLDQCELFWHGEDEGFE